MSGTKNMMLKLSLVIILCGTVLMGARYMSLNMIELFSRILLAGGCIAVIAASVFAKRVPSPAYNGFSANKTDKTLNLLKFSDIAANAEAKACLEGLVDYLQEPEKYKNYGARMPRGVMLYGPPGTGKTLLARALAGEAGVPFFALSGSDFVQMYVGVGAGRVRELFANARKAGKCVIFIDEIDALGKRRNDSASEERDQTLNALLSEMSGFKADEGIIVLAATNRIEAIDPALLRPGRFDRQIEVGLPGCEERYDILKLHSKNKPLSDEIDLKRLAKDTCAFSGASLEALLNEAAISAAQRCAESIDNSDIDHAYYKTIAGEDGKSASDIEERCSVAVHEAGHAIALRLLQPKSHIKRISILSASRGAAGYNLAIPQEKVLLKKSDMEAQVAVLLAGRAAELLVGGDEALTSGASGDLARAAEIVSAMILDLGMGGEPSVSLRALGNSCGGMGNTAELCRQKLAESYERVYTLLGNNASLMMDITEALMKKETLNEEDIEDIFRQYKL